MSDASQHDDDLLPVQEPLWGGPMRAAVALLAFGGPFWLLVTLAVRVTYPLSLPSALGIDTAHFTEVVRELHGDEMIETTVYTVDEMTLITFSAIYALPPVLLAVLLVLAIGLIYRLLVDQAERRASVRSRRAWDAEVAGDVVLTEQSWAHHLPERDVEEPTEPPATE